MSRDRAALVFAWFVVAVVLSGCTSGFAAYAQAPEYLVDGSDDFAFDDASIAESFAKDDQLRFPVRMAITGVEHNIWGTFRDVETHDFEQAFARADETFSDVMPLPEFLDQQGGRRDMRSLRRAAARTRADALLVYQQHVTVDEERNAWSFLNVTVVGLLVVPTVDLEMRIETRAALVDVRHGLVYTTVRDVREASKTATSAGAEDSAKEMKRDLRAESFEAIRESLEEKIARLKERAEAP
ncbi:MAG: hypothetical protein ACYTDX_09325 [Planctomycetota bacterium]|jgi:hypothetical protein